MPSTKRTKKSSAPPAKRNSSLRLRDEFDMQRITDFPIKCRLLREQYSDPRSRLSELSAFVVACDLDPFLADYAEARLGSTAGVSYTNVQKHSLDKCQAIQSVCVLLDGTLVVGNRDACLLHVFPRYGAPYKFRTVARAGYGDLLQPHVLAAVRLPDGSDGVAVAGGWRDSVRIYDLRGGLVQRMQRTANIGGASAMATDSRGRLVTAENHCDRGHHSLKRYEFGAANEPVPDETYMHSVIRCRGCYASEMRGLAFNDRFAVLARGGECMRFSHGILEHAIPAPPEYWTPGSGYRDERVVHGEYCGRYTRNTYRDLPLALDADDRLAMVDMSHNPVGRAVPVLRIHPAPDARAGEAIREIPLFPSRAEPRLPLAMAIDYRGHVFTVDGSNIVREYY